MTDYLAFPGLMVSLKTGKPMNSRLTSSVTVDKERKREVDDIFKTLRAIVVVPVRLGASQEDGMVMMNKHGEKVRREMWKEEKRTARIIDALNHCCHADKVREVIAPVTAHFVGNMHKDSEDNGLIHGFDNMVRFHKHAVFAHFGATDLNARS